MAQPESQSPVTFPAISPAAGAGAPDAGDTMRYGTPARSYGSREGTPVGAGPSGIVPSPAQQLQQLHDAMHLSRRPPPPIVNGVTPYLDVMTISSAQFPATIDGGKNQEEHTRLLMEPIAVPNLDHTGVPVRGTQKKVPLFYPTGKKNCNFRDTIRGRVRTVARSGILTPDVAQQDALADSIRDVVKEQLAARHEARMRRSRSRGSAGGFSPPGTANRARERARMMRGEHAMTPGFSTALMSTLGTRDTHSSARHRRRAGTGTSTGKGRRKKKGGGKKQTGRRRTNTAGTSGSRSVVSRSSSRSAGSRRRHHSPGSVASGTSAFSAGRRSVRSGMSRVRAIDAETRMLLRSLSTTNEAMTRALTRA